MSSTFTNLNWLLISLLLINYTQSSITKTSFNELYLFYNHTNPSYWTQDTLNLEGYSKIFHQSVLLSLQNLTGHSMNISQQVPFENQAWTYGGIVDWKPCMVFNIKLSSGDCPSISNPVHTKFS